LQLLKGVASDYGSDGLYCTAETGS
jgi:hypothetical protein